MKFKSIALSLLLVAGAISAFYFIPNDKRKHIVLFSDAPESDEGGEAGARAKWELMRLADPSGKIPDNIRAKELAFAATLPKYDFNYGGRSSVPVFNPRGPWNVGGRSRTLAIDVTNENIIFCGSVNGGLWRSADGGSTWTCVSRRSQIPAVTCIAQDQRPGHTNTWYYGTGEGYGTSAGAPNAFYSGNGIYKSTDGGLTWDSLPSTYSTPPSSIEPFDLNWALATDNSDPANDVIYAATLFYGIRMSKDGGATWTVDLNTTNAYFTDIKVSSTGIAYAAVSHGNSGVVNSGMWRKQNSTWTKISPSSWDTTTYNRYVIAINPSNENEVYFLGGNTPYHGKKIRTFTDDIEYNSLWKYTYISGNGSGNGGQWTDLSQNLPADTSTISFGNFFTQGGYDLVVSVHPDSSNIVFIGGTNLYRSNDGFTSPNNTKLIGGYDPAYSLPFYQLYPNHHPDQHGIAFLPSNHSVMLQTNDGGIYKTLDCNADSVTWLSLNDGYVTSQFYTVAIDHGSSPNDIIIGGLQDNGSYFTNNKTLTRPWAMPGAGDGSYCYVEDGHQTYYFSRQQGAVAKVKLDTAGQVTAFRRMDPITGLKKEDYIFINPFVIDPNKNNAMFMAAGNKVWRNDSLDQIQLTNEWDSITQGWFKMPDTVPNLIVTSLAMSKTPAGRLYYGTNRRKIYRVDNPYAANPTAKEITGTKNPGNFPATGYISCIAVDPTDANKVIVVFSNYGVYSMYYTTTGDTPWVKIAGNLETSYADISFRWASIIPVNTGMVYLVGTSIGLFGTSTIDSTRTRWTQLDPNGIGNMVVDMIDYRASDGLVVVATHGSGVYSAIIHDVLPVGLSDIANDPPSVIKVYPNPANTQAVVAYALNKSENVSIKIYDLKGDVVQTAWQGKMGEGEHQFIIDRKNLPAGMYFINIKAGNALNETRKIVFRD